MSVGISIVNRANGNGNSPLTVTIPATTLGNTLVVVIGFSFMPRTVSGVSDNGTGTDVYQAVLGSYHFVTATTGGQIWYAKNIEAGVTSVTISISTVGNPCELWTYELQGTWDTVVGNGIDDVVHSSNPGILLGALMNGYGPSFYVEMCGYEAGPATVDPPWILDVPLASSNGFVPAYQLSSGLQRPSFYVGSGLNQGYISSAVFFHSPLVNDDGGTDQWLGGDWR